MYVHIYIRMYIHTYLAQSLNISSIVSGWSIKPVGPLRRGKDTSAKASVMETSPV